MTVALSSNACLTSVCYAEVSRSTSPEVQKSAIIALGKMGAEGAKFAPQIAERLRSSDYGVQSFAATELGHMGVNGEPFAPQIAELLKSSAQGVKGSAAQALVQMGIAQPETALVANLLKTSDIDLQALIISAVGQEGVAGAPYSARIAALLKSPKPQIQSAALTALGQMGAASEPYVSEIAKLLKSSDPSIQSAAATALGSGPPNAAQAALAVQSAELLRSSDPSVQTNAVQALDNMGTSGTKFAPQIAELLERSDPSLQAAVAVAIGHMVAAGCPVPPHVIELLKSSDQNLRLAAASVVGQMGVAGAPYTPRIAALLKSSDPVDQNVAVIVLGQIGASAAPYAADIAELLKSPDPQVQSSATTALGQIGAAGAPIEALVANLLKSSDSNIQGSAATALGQMGPAAGIYAPQIADLLKSPDPTLQSTATGALGLLGLSGASFAPQVADLMKGSDMEVRRDVNEAITNIGLHPNPRMTLTLIDAGYDNKESDGTLSLWAYLMGGGSEICTIYMKWLPISSDGYRPAISTLNEGEAHSLLITFLDALQNSKNLINTRTRIAQLTADWARSQNSISTDNKIILKKISANISADFPDQARTLNEALHDTLQTWIIRIGVIILFHAIFWIILIFFYPYSPMIQALFFWNPWARRMFGFGYVGLLLTIVPCFRRKLFQPFKESLIPLGLVEGFNRECYFDHAEVTDENNDNPVKRVSLLTFVKTMKGQIVLLGQSGLGKTSLLQYLAVNSKRTLVFLRARDCADNVVTAIQRRLQGQARDEKYLRSLVYAGALDVLIDGLNEASPETRARISQFFEEHFRGNVFLTTQLLQWKPPPTAQVVRLLPLLPTQMKAFFHKQWDAVQATACVTKAEYHRLINEFLDEILQATEMNEFSDPKLIVLCNPLEASLAAEIFAKGEHPDLFKLVEQRFKSVSTSFREKYGREFRLEAFAERVYDWRKSDTAYINTATFEDEVLELSDYRLMIQRTEKIRNQENENENTRWFFRHDRIMDFFLLPAFLNKKEVDRRFDHRDDERFWGVYELLATRLPANEESELYAYINEWAARTDQSVLRNRYELARLAGAASRVRK